MGFLTVALRAFSLRSLEPGDESVKRLIPQSSDGLWARRLSWEVVRCVWPGSTQQLIGPDARYRVDFWSSLCVCGVSSQVWRHCARRAAGELASVGQRSCHGPNGSRYCHRMENPLIAGPTRAQLVRPFASHSDCRTERARFARSRSCGSILARKGERQ